MFLNTLPSSIYIKETRTKLSIFLNFALKELDKRKQK